MLVFHEGQQSAGCRVPRRFVSGDDDNQAPGHDVHVGQGFAVDFHLGEERDEVIAWVLAFLFRELAKIGKEFQHGFLGAFIRGLSLDPKGRILGANNSVRPIEEKLPVLLGESQHPCDDRNRERGRHGFNEVTLSLPASFE